MIISTQHYLERAFERYGLEEEKATKLMQKAFSRGKTAEEMQSRERKYLISKDRGDGCRSVYYKQKIFIFSDTDNCLTVYDPPEWFGQHVCYDGKTKIRKAKRYVRCAYTYAEEFA